MKHPIAAPVLDFNWVYSFSVSFFIQELNQSAAVQLYLVARLKMCDQFRGSPEQQLCMWVLSRVQLCLERQVTFPVPLGKINLTFCLSIQA